MSSKLEQDKCEDGMVAAVVPKNTLDILTEKTDKLFAIIVTIAIIAELIFVPTNVVVRNFFSFSFFWAEEVGRLALLIMAFIGGAVAYNRKGHMAMLALVSHLSEHRKSICAALGDWLVFTMGVVGCILSQKMALMRWDEMTPMLRLREAWFILPVTIGMVLFCFFALNNLRKQNRRIVMTTGIFVTLLVAIILVSYLSLGRLDQSILLCLTFAIFAGSLLIGLPIAFVLVLSSLFYILFTSKVSLTAIPHAMQVSMGSFLLLAIPFFMLAGFVMTSGGLSRRIADAVIAIMGHLRGGLLYVIVVFTYIVSGLSGSKLADVAAVGTTMTEALDKHGYKRGETAAVLASSAIMGESIPPCINLLVLASNTTLSVGSLFIAGLIPATVVAVVIMALIYFRARQQGMTGAPRVPFNEKVKKTIFAIPALIAIVILVGTIVSGFATPTEGSTGAVIYALLLSLVYREMDLSKCWRALEESAVMTSMVLFIICAASAFSWTLTVARIPHELATLLGYFNGSTGMFMILSLIILLPMGALLEGLPAVLIFGPLLVPLATQFGVSPLQYGIFLIIALGTGVFAPPIGMGAYFCCAIVKTSIEDMSKHIIPYLTVIVIGLLLIAFVPWFCLVLPRALNMI